MAYNPQKDGIVVSKPFGAIGFNVDARSTYYDDITKTRRPFVSTAEVLSYFDTAFKREGNFTILVDDGSGVVKYWFKDGVADSDLVLENVGGSGGSTDWSDITNKPTFIAAGSTEANARAAIGAGTSNLTLGVTSTTAKAGDYTPSMSDVTGLNTALSNKVDKVAGKSLILDTEITRLSTVTNQDISGKQDTLVSATNIKTINGVSVLGSGDLIVSGGGGGGAVLSVAGKTGVVTLDKNDVGLTNVDNTSDSAKEVLSATKLLTPRNINGVAFDGTANITVADSTKEPTANKSITLTSPDDIKFPTTKAVSDVLALKAPLASPTFTGTVGGITASMVGAPSGSGTSTGTNTGDQTWTTLSGKPTFATVATTGAYADLSGTPSLAGYAPLASPTFTGTPTLPTGTIAVKQTVGDNTTAVATTSFVAEGLATKAPIREDIVSVTGSKTFALTDENKFQDVTANSSLTVPLNSAVAFPVGTEIEGAIRDTITGTFVATGGVTIINKSLIVAGLTAFTLKKVATDTWLLTTNASSGGGTTILFGSTTLNSTDVNTNRFKDVTVTGANLLDIVSITDNVRISGNLYFLSGKVISTNTVRIYVSYYSFHPGTSDVTLSAISIATAGALPWSIDFSVIKKP